jgi:hypothetical protein
MSTAMALCCVACGGPAAFSPHDGTRIVHAGNGDLQKTIDAAAPHSTIICDPNRQLVLAVPFRGQRSIVADNVSTDSTEPSP